MHIRDHELLEQPGLFLQVRDPDIHKLTVIAGCPGYPEEYHYRFVIF